MCKLIFESKVMAMAVAPRVCCDHQALHNHQLMQRKIIQASIGSPWSVGIMVASLNQQILERSTSPIISNS